MNLLLLPGKNPRNKEWLVEVENTLAPLFDTTQRFNFGIWDTDKPELDLAAEESKLASEVGGLGTYSVFAKSAGSMLTCKAIFDAILQPKACLFAGFPLAMIRRFALPADQWLRAVHVPVTIAQNANDPIGSYDQVQAYIEQLDLPNISVHRLEGDTHDYTELSALKQLAANMS